MHRPTKLKMSDLNPHLTCVLCDGYFVDATTIVECLHSFCRACIVKYLETNKFCPICDVQVHKTKPLLSIRSDKTLQDVVYKLVPRLYKDEMKKRVEFYSEHPEEAARCTSEERGECAKQRFIYTPDETISLSLEYGTGDSKESPVKTDGCQDSVKQVPTKRYLQCPAAITVGHLKKFISAKFAVPPLYEVDISYSGDVLNEDYTLMDVAYIFAWRRSGPMKLFYQVKSRPVKRRKISHPVEEMRPVVPVIKEPERKKAATEFPTLRLLPSPSAVANEFKFVLKTVSPKKEEKPNELTTTPNNQRLVATTEQTLIVPSVVKSDPTQSSLTSVKIVAEVPLLSNSASSKSASLGNNISKEFVAQTVASQNVLRNITTVTSSGNKTPVFSNSTVAQTTPLLQPVLCSTYRTPTATKVQTGSKRPTRSRVKNRTIQRPPLVRLAPYPPPQRTNSPTTNSLVPQVNHFSPSPVTCFTAPPATCLSTAPVNCLGTVSVNYLPNASVACFEPSSMNSATAVNVNNLVTTSVNNVPITTSFSRISAENPRAQVSIATSPVTAVVDTSCSKTQTVSSTMASCVVTSSKSIVTMPVVTASSQSFVGTTSAAIGRSAQVTSVPSAPMNSHSMPATIPLAPKLTITKSRENKVLKSAIATEKKAVMFLGNSNSFQTNDSHGLPVTSVGPPIINSTMAISQSDPAPSMPVISMDVLPSSNSTTSIPATVFHDVAVKSVSFSVNSLLPSVTAPQNSSSGISDINVTSSPSLPLSIPKPPNSSQLSNSISLPVKETSITPKSDLKDQIILENKSNLQVNNIESLSISPVSTEKNSINTPFKEVKSSIITAEFSDNDDLGCQPDLVVDEQKLDSSDNEDEAEEALRRKIAAIAEKEDEVDVELDNETDSGRASDVSNQARSSCDDDIGSPLPRSSEFERLAQTTTNNSNSLSVTFLPATSPVVPTTPTKSEEPLPPPSKPNGIDHIINNLHRNHERKDNIGALDLSTSCRKAGDQSPRPRARQVANPPVLDAKHRQQTCLSAPTKQHTACVPAPKHPTTSSFPIRTLSASRHGMMPAPVVDNSMTKASPVTIPHFSPTPLLNAFPVKTPQALSASHFCRTPQIPIHSNANPFHTGKANASSRQSKSNSRSANPSSTSGSRKSASVTNGRRDSVSPRHSSALSPSTPSPMSPHQRLSPCVTPPKGMPSLPVPSVNNVLSSVPSTSSYKVSRPQIPIYKKSDSYKNSPHHNRFKGSNLTVINPDPNGFRQRIVIKNLDSLPNNHNNNHRFVK